MHHAETARSSSSAFRPQSWTRNASSIQPRRAWDHRRVKRYGSKAQEMLPSGQEKGTWMLLGPEVPDVPSIWYHQPGWALQSVTWLVPIGLIFLRPEAQVLIWMLHILPSVESAGNRVSQSAAPWGLLQTFLFSGYRHNMAQEVSNLYQVCKKFAGGLKLSHFFLSSLIKVHGPLGTDPEVWNSLRGFDNFVTMR